MRIYPLFFLLLLLTMSGCQSMARDRSQSVAIDALLQLSWAHLHAGRHQAALPLLDHAEQLAPWDVRVRTARAEWYRQRGDLDEAVAMYRAYWPEDAAMALAFGQWLADQSSDQDLELAVRVLSRAVDQTGYSGQAEALLWRGRVNRRLGHWKMATEDLKRALALDPWAEQSASELMAVYLDQGHSDQAHALLSEWQTERPDDPAILQMRLAWAAYLERMRRINPRFGS